MILNNSAGTTFYGQDTSHFEDDVYDMLAPKPNGINPHDIN
jgi:hypothetical protein